MPGDPLAGQSRKLEDLFFLEEDRKLIEKARQIEKMKLSCAALKEVSGIHDEKILQKLVSLNVDPKTVSCLSLVPLVEVAWADGEVDEAERRAVLAAAADSGMKPGGVDHQLLESWVCRRPQPKMLEAWTHYVRGLCQQLTPDEKRRLKDDIMGQARSVAEASGGFLGLGSKISAHEERVLKKLESAFA
ncbi:MAG: TerB family tellurite resistance protein [Elusimicrobia bacterium]|nr:TerB family tellurite resistance protein [Elusimicrobiota bacterium]